MKNQHHPAVAFLLLLGLVAGACRSSLEAPAAEDAEAYSNTVRWSTASELDNFGYDVYRAESPDGPFRRLTEEPVEGAGTSDEVHRYHFVDETIDPTKTYYYYVESVSMSGVRERFTAVGSAKPKLPKEEADAEDVPDDGES